ncbi:hypothetical protein [Formosa sp. Hel1_33_131]|uniref:hypothetical protein n=1 Tax=Formosa sp. Hel1_33_131 TaxID=1336794 RepID=UPI00084E286F|nr:hypothetical protein [Formosa sp. Hel1_33_131]
MRLKSNIIEKAESYIEKNDLGISPEEMFIEFQEMYQLHIEFDNYVKENGLNKKLEQMQRNKRLLEKRKLFVEWYFVKTQDDLSVKEAFINLSEMIFASTKTVQKDLLKEATD